MTMFLVGALLGGLIASTLWTLWLYRAMCDELSR